jgi:thymidylate synthase
MNINSIYHDLLEEILKKGYRYLDPNRKKQGIYRKQINRFNFEYDMSGYQDFPALTTKKLFFDSVVAETLWILSGRTNIKWLTDRGVNIWNKDAFNYRNRVIGEEVGMDTFLQNLGTENYVNLKGSFNYLGGDVGKNYSYQLRNWEGEVDQLRDLIDTLKNNPMATKKVVTYWNPAEKNETALTPCHRSWEAIVEPLYVNDEVVDYELSISFDMSSVDVFLGLPFNIASYGLICHILATFCGMKVGKLYGNLTNVHIYEPHIDKVNLQLSNNVYKFYPGQLKISKFFEIAAKRDLNFDVVLGSLDVHDFELPSYESYPAIRAEMFAYDK